MTVHCLERSIERSIEVEDIECAIESGEIIEYYPEDKYGPSCLILGYTKEAGRSYSVFHSTGMDCYLL